MKSILEYIDTYSEDKYLNEGLLSWFKAFFKKLKNSQYSRIKDGNKVDMYKADTTKLKVQKEPIAYDDIDKDTLELWNSKQVGYPITSQILANPKKYLTDGDKEFKPDIYCYFSQDGDNTYSVALIMVENNITYMDGYKHIVNLESSLIVDNPTEINKAVLTQYSELVKKEDANIKGFTARGDLHPKLKGSLIKLGFKSSNGDKNILVYNI